MHNKLFDQNEMYVSDVSNSVAFVFVILLTGVP